MKITVLSDNTPGNGLEGEWGLSFYIEYCGKVVLLDSGLSGLFAENADKLGLDLNAVDHAVLSHAHDDHANGFDTFFERNDHAKLFVSRECGENCYDYDKEKKEFVYAGIPRGIMERHADRIVKADPDMMIDEGIRLLAHTTPGLDELGRMEQMYLMVGPDEYIIDDFRHEQSLIFELDEGIVVFNSCSHAGADNIINEAMEAYPGRRILAIIGGFHLFNKTDEYVREFSGRVLNTGVTAVYTGHCTGDKAMAIMREELGDKLHAFKTGLVIEI